MRREDDAALRVGNITRRGPSGDTTAKVVVLPTFGTASDMPRRTRSGCGPGARSAHFRELPEATPVPHEEATCQA